MDSQCYKEGSCKLCGCKTTALQMASKPCDKPCYPALLKKKQWKEIRNSSYSYFIEKRGDFFYSWRIDRENYRFVLDISDEQNLERNIH